MTFYYKTFELLLTVKIGKSFVCDRGQKNYVFDLKSCYNRSMDVCGINKMSYSVH